MRINLNIPNELAVALKQFAAANRRTVTAETILALEAYLKDVMKKPTMPQPFSTLGSSH